MKSLILLTLSALPSTFSLALHARQQNHTATPTTIVPPPFPTSYTQADVATNCARWDRMTLAGPFKCTEILELYPETTYADLILWNPSVGPLCDNIWRGYWFCSAISGPYIPPVVNLPAGTPIPAPREAQSGTETDPLCDRWDRIPTDSSCQTFQSRHPGLTRADIFAWNPTVGSECYLNWARDLCTSVVGHVFPPLAPVVPPTTPTGPKPPAPTQVGVNPACQVWDKVQEGEGCSVFLERYGLTLETLVEWNPAIGKGCEYLWQGYAVCVGV